MNKKKNKNDKVEKDNIFKQLRLEYNHKVSMDKNELSQSALANEMGMNRSHITKLEAGQTPGIDDYVYYHKKFDVTIEYLLGETAAKKPENMRVGADLGVTDAVADTMKEIKDASSEENDYSAVLNAFIGNGEDTFNFISEIFTYFLSEHVNGRKPVTDALMLSTIMNYLEYYVRPQLTDVFDRSMKSKEELQLALDALPPEVRYS